MKAIMLLFFIYTTILSWPTPFSLIMMLSAYFIAADMILDILDVYVPEWMVRGTQIIK